MTKKQAYLVLANTTLSINDCKIAHDALDRAGAFALEAAPAGGSRAYDLHSPRVGVCDRLDGEPKFCIELTPRGARELCDALDVCVREGQGGAVIETIVEALERQGHDSVELRSLRAELGAWELCEWARAGR